MNKYLPKVSSKKGFTLIELMVVIAILAVLAVTGLAVFGNSQQSARDARRQAEVEAISKVLETRYDGNAVAASRYPALNANMFSDKKIPTDPTNTSPYTYNSNALPSSTYYVCARMETGKGGNYNDNTASATGSSYFCRTAQQQ